MSKKRTKKQKQRAKHNFTISWEPSLSEAKNKGSVKGQFNSEPKGNSAISKKDRNTENSVQTDIDIKTRKNIIKSLILAGIILGSEIVLYFFWK